jgi:hypothetical protein
MIRKICFLIPIYISLSLLSCALPPITDHALYKSQGNLDTTQLEARELQNRVYDTANTGTVLKAMMNVLQDDGYSIKNLDFNAGFFNAVKERTRDEEWRTIIRTFKDDYEATVNVTKFGEKTKVRITFNYRFSAVGGVPVEHRHEYINTEIYDPQFYQDFFNKVDKAIFIENQKL